MTTRIGTAGAAALVALVVAFAPAAARAEEGPSLIPVLGMHIVPSMSVVLPVGGAGAVTTPYGVIHPAGSLGLSLHVNDRFAFVVDLEAEGWSGQLEIPGAETIDIRFLSYWLHVRARTRLVRLGRVSILLDAGVGLIFSREDAELFRGEGEGFSIGAGPLVEISLGRWISLSLGMLFEAGWVYYDVRSPQGATGDSEYVMSWPRVLFGLGIDGWVIHRPATRRRQAEPLPPPPMDPEPEAEAEAEPAAPEPAPATPAMVPPPASSDEEPESPF